jgi:hypothetical protein
MEGTNAARSFSFIVERGSSMTDAWATPQLRPTLD